MSLRGGEEGGRGRFPYYTRNLWFDLSATAHFFADSPYEEQLVWVARQIGTDRLLFGSDWWGRAPPWQSHGWERSPEEVDC